MLKEMLINRGLGGCVTQNTSVRGNTNSDSPLRGDRQIVLALNDVRIPAAPFLLRSTLPPALANAYALGTTGDARPYPIDTASFWVCEIPVYML